MPSLPPQSTEEHAEQFLEAIREDKGAVAARLLDALRAHGGDLSSRQQPYENTALYFLVGHQDDRNGEADWFKGFTWLLEHERIRM